MPPIVIKMTTPEIQDYVDDEGLGYAVESGLSADNIEDFKLSVLWTNAEAALRAVRAHLKNV